MEKNSLGKKLYDLLSPPDPTGRTNPAQWDDIPEHWHGHYERAAQSFRAEIVKECAKIAHDHAAKTAAIAEAIPHDFKGDNSMRRRLNSRAREAKAIAAEILSQITPAHGDEGKEG